MISAIQKRIFFMTGSLISIGIVALAGLPVTGSSQTDTIQGPRIIEKLGETVPLDLTFIDTEGKPVVLGDLIDRPTVLTLVYYRCPSICSPLLREVAKTVDMGDLEVGVDYQLLTISFDKREGPDLSTIARNTIYQLIEKEIPSDGWRFMTGDEANINGITEAVGFYYERDKEDFNHPTVVIFLSEEGKIVRYLNGLSILPVDLKMAILDASEGRVSSVMQKIQRLCYSYDPEERTYILQINRLILYGTIFFVVLFAIYVVSRGRKERGVGEARS
jgi:protein SCO1/2